MEKIEKKEVPIHTVFVIKNGSLDVGDPSELEKKNYFYQVYSRIDGIALIDYDKTDIVPITKDILNRQHTFIEITYLKWLLGLTILSIFGMTFLTFYLPAVKPSFEPQKVEIITELRKLSQTLTQTQGANAPAKVNTPTSTPETSTGGYNPIPLDNTIQNTHKNVPNYAN